MSWFAVPRTGSIDYCDECGGAMAWIDGPDGRLPLDMSNLRGQSGAWEAKAHGPQCNNKERWERRTDQGVGAGESEGMAETDPSDEALPGPGSLFG